MKKIVIRLLPARFTYADHFTSSAKSLFLRLGVAVVGLLAAAFAVGLLNRNNWTDVLAGALFAWSTSFLVWAVNSYRARTEHVSKELRHMAELDLLHGRLNHVAYNMGLPLMDLSGDIEAVIRAREERIAHFSGFDEYRPMGTQEGADWWDPIALGYPTESDRT